MVYRRILNASLKPLVLAFFLLGVPHANAIDAALPEAVHAHISAPLVEVGRGVFRKFGFRVYEAALWATQKPWDAAQPYALQLRYTRDVSKETLIETVMDDIENQGIADEITRERWKSVLETSLTDVEEGDELIGLTIPDQETILLYNGTPVVQIDEKAFSDAFFGIWLSDHANEDLRASLLGSE